MTKEQKSKIWRGIALAISFSVFVGFICLIITIDMSKPQPDHNPPIFHAGNFVQAKIDGRTGQVLESGWNYQFSQNTYCVRFGTFSAEGDAPLLGGKTPIDASPYALVWMLEMELMPNE